jgi:hypothetical protein
MIGFDDAYNKWLEAVIVRCKDLQSKPGLFQLQSANVGVLLNYRQIMEKQFNCIN